MLWLLPVVGRCFNLKFILLPYCSLAWKGLLTPELYGMIRCTQIAVSFGIVTKVNSQETCEFEIIALLLIQSSSAS